MRYLHRIHRIPFLIWYSKHELTHILIGLVFAWFLRELWMELSPRYIFLSIIGSLIIDADHLLYLFVYARHEWYSVEARKILRQGQIGTLLRFWRDNHKQNTGLLSHNIYFLIFFFCVSAASFYFDWKGAVVFFGAIVLHLLFDIFDDLWVLGKINENWKHLTRSQRLEQQNNADTNYSNNPDPA